MKRFLQVIRYGWRHTNQIATNEKKNRLTIFLEILSCFYKYKMWSNQYLAERFWEKSKEERKIIGETYFEKGKIRDEWQRDFHENNEFLIEYTQMKYERARLREKRNNAYAKRYNAGEGLFVEHDVILKRQHYLWGTIKIGRNVLLAKNVFIDYTGNVEIGNDVQLTNGVIIESHEHPWHSDYKKTNDWYSKDYTIPTSLKICDDVIIGSRAIILASCHYIGEHARVGAGAIVTHDVPDYAIVAGVPARVIRMMEHCVYSNWHMSNLSPTYMVLFFVQLISSCSIEFKK